MRKSLSEQKDRKTNQIQINQVSDQKGRWRKMIACVDSGAVRSVAPKIVAPGVKITETKESKSGKVFRAANGSEIKIYGEKRYRAIRLPEERHKFATP